MQALQRLDAAHKVDFQRVMVLRTASNYSMPPPGHNSVESLTGGGGNFSGYLPSLESAYAAGSTVIHAILANWAKFGPAAPEMPSTIRVDGRINGL
jgi:purine nucleoside permease